LDPEIRVAHPPQGHQHKCARRVEAKGNRHFEDKDLALLVARDRQNVRVRFVSRVDSHLVFRKAQREDCFSGFFHAAVARLDLHQQQRLHINANRVQAGAYLPMKSHAMRDGGPLKVGNTGGLRVSVGEKSDGPYTLLY
jgi:hypothetical protein